MPGQSRATPTPKQPTYQAHHQNGGWIRSMPWSKTLPIAEDVRVTRANLPSTVSRKVMIQAQTSPNPNWPCQNSQKAARTSRNPMKVTWLGRKPATAHQRVTMRAGIGHQYLVTTSVT